MPSLGDSLYWMTGAFAYELAASGVMLFLAALWRSRLTPLRRGLVRSRDPVDRRP